MANNKTAVQVKVDPAVEERQVQEVVQDWTKVLTCTELMDRPTAEEAVLKLYEAANLKRPMDARGSDERDKGPEIIYCTSLPDYYAKALAFAESIKGTDESAKSFTKNTAASALSTPWSDGNWLAADDYYVKFVEKETPNKVHPITYLKEFARTAFALATFEKVAFIVERPRIIQYRENDGELQWHNVNGPVLEWPDGERMYAIEGFFVDEQLVVHPETQTMEQIHKENNLELRRIRIERFGWPNYLKQSGAKVLDKRRNDVDGGTYEALCEVTALEARVHLCTCATGRVFALLVPPATASCTEASTYLAGNPQLTSVGRT